MSWGIGMRALHESACAARGDGLNSEGSGGRPQRTTRSTLCMKEGEKKAPSNEHYRQVHELESGQYDG